MSIPKTQEQFLQDALNLKKDNPELDIVFCTSYDELCDEYAWSCQQIDSVAIHPWYEHRERIYTDEQSILEELEEEIYNEKMSDEDLESEAKKLYAERVKQKICVYLIAGGA